MSLINLFKEFHRDAIQQEFPPSTRVLFDTLLYKFNEAFWTDKLVLSERELISLTGLPKTTVSDAKHFLAARHIIKITKFKNKTAYSLCDEWAKLAPTNSRPLSDQSPTTFRPVPDRFGGLSITREHEDVKTEDVKTSHTLTARAREEDCDIFKVWREKTESPILGDNKYDLIAKAEENFELTTQAIVQAMETKTTFVLQYAHFKKTYDKLKNPQLRIVKGGEKRASNPQKQGYAYAPPPEYNIDFESD